MKLQEILNKIKEYKNETYLCDAIYEEESGRYDLNNCYIEEEEEVDFDLENSGFRGYDEDGFGIYIINTKREKGKIFFRTFSRYQLDILYDIFEIEEKDR